MLDQISKRSLLLVLVAGCARDAIPGTDTPVPSIGRDAGSRGGDGFPADGSSTPPDLGPYVLRDIPSPACVVDDVTGIPPSGVMTVGWPRDPRPTLVPLCSGFALFGNRELNQVEVLDVFRGQVRETYPLPVPPGDMALDAERGLLWVALEAAMSVARIDLARHGMSMLKVGGPARGVTVGNAGRVFVFQRTAVTLIDGAKATVEKTVAGDFGTTGSYSRPGDRLVSTTPHELSGGEADVFRLRRHRFDPQSLALTHEETARTRGVSMALAVSPDGRHTALGELDQSLLDRSTVDFKTVFGDWRGGQMRDVAFSPDGGTIATVDGEILRQHDVIKHTLLRTFAVQRCRDQGFAFGIVDRVAFSRGGRLIHTFVSCGILGGSRGLVTWVVVP